MHQTQKTLYEVAVNTLSKLDTRVRELVSNEEVRKCHGRASKCFLMPLRTNRQIAAPISSLCSGDLLPEKVMLVLLTA